MFLVMASSGNHGTAKAKDLRVLLPFTTDSLVRLARMADFLTLSCGADYFSCNRSASLTSSPRRSVLVQTAPLRSSSSAGTAKCGMFRSGRMAMVRSWSEGGHNLRKHAASVWGGLSFFDTMAVACSLSRLSMPQGARNPTTARCRLQIDFFHKF